MPQIANTFATFSAVGNREELADAIYNIAPEETPFVSSIGKGKAARSGKGDPEKEGETRLSV